MRLRSGGHHAALYGRQDACRYMVMVNRFAGCRPSHGALVSVALDPADERPALGFAGAYCAQR